MDNTLQYQQPDSLTANANLQNYDDFDESILAVKGKKKKMQLEQKLALLAVLVPLAGFLIFQIVPVIISFVVMFCDMDYYDLTSLTWNNFENFKTVFNDPIFYKSLLVSFVCTIAQMISLLVSLIVSTLLNKKSYGHKVFQLLFFIPYICSSVAVSIIFRWMYDVNFGIINTILTSLFGDSASVNWFQEPVPYLVMIMTVIVWQAPGYGIVMYKSAYGTINPALYEAAEIDGAGPLRKFFKITLPSLAPTTFFLLLSGIIAGMQTFEVAKLMAGDPPGGTAGPNYWGMSTILYVYNNGIKFSNMPVASVMSWLLFAIIVTVSAINFKIRAKKESI